MFSLLLFLVGCGGGGGGSSTPPSPTGDFSIVAESSSVTIQQQGAFVLQSLQVNPSNGFAGTVTLALSGLPVGVVATAPSPYFVTTMGNMQVIAFQLSASTTAAASTNTITVTGTSGSITHSIVFSLNVTPVAPFSIQAKPGTLSLTPASNVAVQISVIANPGTSPQLQTSVSGLPLNSGINLLLPQGFLTTSNPVNFTVEAGALAQPLQDFPIVVTATEGTNSSVAVVPLTVSVPSSFAAATRSTFATTYNNPTAAVYDPGRKLLFATVETLNEVTVISTVDAHEVATIPVEFPSSIDETSDGSAVYVGSPFSPYVTTIDPNSLQVIQQTIIPQIGSGATSTQPSSALQITALSSGEVLLQVANSIALGSHLYLWTPTTNNFTELAGQSSTFQTQLLQRSADHSKVLFSGVNSGGAFILLYDVRTNTFTGPANISGSDFLALSPDGSQIVAEGMQSTPTTFYDSSLNLVGSISLDVFPADGVIYSLDGRRVYAFGVFFGDNSPFVDGVAVIDTQTFSLVGVVPDFQLNGGNASTPLAVDETGMVFAGNAFPGAAQGVEFLDASSPGFFRLPVPGVFLVQPALLSTTASTQTQLSGAGFLPNFTYQVFFGLPPASPQALPGTGASVQSDNFLNVTAPAGPISGPANTTLTRSDGFFEVMPNAASFGPSILLVSPNAGSPRGGDSINIFGYGFGDAQNLQVTIGGKAATIGRVQVPPGGSGRLPIDTISVVTPPGAPSIGDVTITTNQGSTTLTGAFQYLSTAQIFPITGALDAIVYDQARQKLYVSNQDHNRVEIFDLTSNTYLSPVPVGNQPTALALTPDNTLLAVANLGDGTVSVINPASMQVVATDTVVTSADKDKQGCAGVVIGIAPATPHRMLVNINCTALLSNGTFHLLNLDNGSLSCTGVAGCSPDGTNLVFDDGLAAMASTPDGSKIFLAGTSAISGQTVGLLDLTANTLSQGFQGTFVDAAADADANIFGASFGVSNAQLLRIGIMTDLSETDAGAQSLHNVFGEKLNSSGSLLFVPQESGVDIFDVHHGRLALHVATPEPIPSDTNTMALDETGSKMFLISNSGITIAKLFKVPLSLASVNPTSGSPGATITLRGSGFQNGAIVAWGTSETTATFVDASTLQAVVPATSAGPLRITITNPNGDKYAFDAAFTVN